MLRRLRVRALITCLAFPAVSCAQAPATPPVPAPELDRSAYPWLAERSADLPELSPLEAVFPNPPGTTRDAVEPGSFAAWLRGLPVRGDRSTVVDYRGRPLFPPAAAVIQLDVGDKDLQQCADTLIRLHAEHLWASGRQTEAAYHFTSGDLSSWTGWVQGERFRPHGNGVVRVSGESRPSDHASYRAWLERVFVYAGTMSLGLDSEPVATAEAIRAGDFFVAPGSPGHTVMVLDAVTTDDGARLGLIGQGFTPAQELHVIEGSGDGVPNGVWFPLPDTPGDALDVPTWSPFPRATARRFNNL